MIQSLSSYAFWENPGILVIETLNNPDWLRHSRIDCTIVQRAWRRYTWRSFDTKADLLPPGHIITLPARSVTAKDWPRSITNAFIPACWNFFLKVCQRKEFSLIFFPLSCFLSLFACGRFAISTSSWHFFFKKINF